MVASQGIRPEVMFVCVIRMFATDVQLSVAVATPVAGGLVFVLHCKLRFGGQVMTGFTVSAEVTVLQALFVQPLPDTVTQTV